MTQPDARVVHVVDDEAEMRNSLAVLLKSLRFRSLLWDDGEAFLENLRSSSPGCVLLDLRMSPVDGITVLKRLKPFGTSFPVVMISGHGDSMMAALALRAGARDFLNKPFTRQNLENAILEACRWMSDPSERYRARERARNKLATLNRREAELLEMFARGHSEQMAAYRLDMPLDDVDLCREIIFLKLEVDRMARAVRTLFEAA